MCKFVGIYGEKGSGRKTAAWLLAKSMEEIRKKTPYVKFVPMFKCWVELVCIDQFEAVSTPHVTLDSFGDSILDQVKLFNPYLQTCDLHDDSTKNMLYVQISTMKVIDEGTLAKMGITPSTIEEVLRYIDIGAEICDNLYLSVGDYIMYYANHVMKKYFGESVWLNSIKATNELVSSTDNHIYWDVKTPMEAEYIKHNDGVLIKLINTKRQKSGSRYKNIIGCRPDIEIDTTSKPLSELAEVFWNCAAQIINK